MRATGWTRGLLVLGLGGLLIAGCAASVFKNDETPGQHFDRMMKEFAENCAKAKLKPNDTACDILKLKPADPLATEEGRFAHSIKIPNPVPEDSGYKPGMTSQEYFDHLCKTEAGEFIYKTVENVEGLYMMRPRKEATDDELSHLYTLEDPYGHVLGVSRRPEEYFVQPAIGKYKFLELPPEPNKVPTDRAKYRRFYRDPTAHPGREYATAIDGRFVRVPYIVASETPDIRKSLYGFTWRGITRPHDQELGIRGGELIILDLQTNEALAVRRGFIRSGNVRNNMTGFWWLTGQVCPGAGGKMDHLFIKEVLKPITEQSLPGGK
ncbi:MAG: hypothetical protein EWM73_01202 [Nitrospira sp.]|nr:MAG: hypothetical protein EWM73_01202 [Nitrospira sp.]